MFRNSSFDSGHWTKNFKCQISNVKFQISRQRPDRLRPLLAWLCRRGERGSLALRSRPLAANARGQSLLELVVVVSVALLVIGGLTFAIIGSLRNANFAKNQAQATKLAQEGLEKVRSLRDRDGSINYVSSNPVKTVTKFSELYTINCNPNKCYAKFFGNILVTASSDQDFEILGNGFSRQIIIQGVLGSKERTITSLVRWNDYSGAHESNISTILRKL